jgi:hypothetical protein
MELFHITHNINRNSLSSISTESTSSYTVSAVKVPSQNFPHRFRTGGLPWLEKQRSQRSEMSSSHPSRNAIVAPPNLRSFLVLGTMTFRPCWFCPHALSSLKTQHPFTRRTTAHSRSTSRFLVVVAFGEDPTSKTWMRETG